MAYVTIDRGMDGASGAAPITKRLDCSGCASGTGMAALHRLNPLARGRFEPVGGNTDTDQERGRRRRDNASMYKRILVALDGSSTSKRALREALGLAKEGGSLVRIAHVIDLVTFDIDTLDKWSRYEESVRAAGERILKQAADLARKAGV